MTTTLHPGTIHVLSLATTLVLDESVGSGSVTAVAWTSVVRGGVTAKVGLEAEVELTSTDREGISDKVGLGAEGGLTSVSEDFEVMAVGVDVQCGPSAVRETGNT